VEALQVAMTGDPDELDIAGDGLAELVYHYARVIAVAPSAAVHDELLSARSFAGTLLTRARPARPDLMPAVISAARYHRGLAPLIIVTGGVNRHDGVVEGREFARLLKAAEVPASVIRVEDQSANTWQNVEFSLPYLREALAMGLHLTAVSKWYHLRTVYCLRTLLPAAVPFYAIGWEPLYAGVPVTRENWPEVPDGRRRVIRESEEVPRRVADGTYQPVTKSGGAWRLSSVSRAGSRLMLPPARRSEAPYACLVPDEPLYARIARSMTQAARWRPRSHSQLWLLMIVVCAEAIAIPAKRDALPCAVADLAGVGVWVTARRRQHRDRAALSARLATVSRDDIPADVIGMVAGGKKIHAIKRYRELTGVSLREANATIDSL
jgi:hypothetical protein